MFNEPLTYVFVLFLVLFLVLLLVALNFGKQLTELFAALSRLPGSLRAASSRRKLYREMKLSSVIDAVTSRIIEAAWMTNRLRGGEEWQRAGRPAMISEHALRELARDVNDAADDRRRSAFIVALCALLENQVTAIETGKLEPGGNRLLDLAVASVEPALAPRATLPDPMTDSTAAGRVEALHARLDAAATRNSLEAGIDY